MTIFSSDKPVETRRSNASATKPARSFGLQFDTRSLVSSSRYQQDGFDLDLAYITPACIAMPFPCVGAEANFLNPMDDIIRFFHTKHDNHFHIFNMCVRQSYDPALFDGKVSRLKVEVDVHVPVDLLVTFLLKVSAWVEEDPSNVFAVHGYNDFSRVAVACCCWLLFSSFCESAQESLQHYVRVR